MKQRDKMSAENTKEWTGKMIYFIFSSIFGDFFFEILKKSRELNRKLK